MASRALISRLRAISGVPRAFSIPRASPLLRLHPLIALVGAPTGGSAGLRCFSTRQATSSLRDSSPNWSNNRPPKETILLDGCDFEHWLVVMDPPDPSRCRDEIIDSYIKTLAQVLGSEEKARENIYSVSTKHYFAFGALVSEELSYKIKALPGVRWVLPDSYLDVINKDYGGEPFINGQAVPYDPKYHKEWVYNNEQANKRSRRNDRPRNDRSRNFDRRGENMQNFQNRDAPTGNQNFQNPMPPVPTNNAQNTMPPRDMPPMPTNNAQNTMPPRDMPPMPNSNFSPPGGNANNAGTMGPNYQNQMPNLQNYYGQNGGRGMLTGPTYQGNTQNYQGGPDYQQGIPPPAYQQGQPPSYQRGNVHNYQQGPPRPNYQQGSVPGYQQGLPSPNYQQGSGPSYQQNVSPTYQPSGPGYQSGESYQVREMPGRDQQTIPSARYMEN